MSKTNQSEAIYFSDDHMYMLYAAAEKTLRMKTYGTIVDLDDLVNAGWIECLRKLPKKKLEGCFTNLCLKMMNSCIEYTQDHSIFIHKKYFRKKKQTPFEEIQNPENYKSLYTSNSLYAHASLEVDNIFSLDVNPKHLKVLKHVYLEEKNYTETAIDMNCNRHKIDLLVWEAIVAIQQALNIKMKV